MRGSQCVSPAPPVTVFFERLAFSFFAGVSLWPPRLRLASSPCSEAPFRSKIAVQSGWSRQHRSMACAARRGQATSSPSRNTPALSATGEAGDAVPFGACSGAVSSRRGLPSACGARGRVKVMSGPAPRVVRESGISLFAVKNDEVLMRVPMRFSERTIPPTTEPLSPSGFRRQPLRLRTVLSRVPRACPHHSGP